MNRHGIRLRRSTGERARARSSTSVTGRFGVAVATILATFLVVLTGAPAAFAAPDPGQSGVDRFGACVAGGETGRVLLLVDESRSLASTDPDAARVTAARFLTEQLSTYADDTGASLDVAIAGFSDTYTERKGWTRLSKDSLGSLTSALDGFADRTGGTDTDYWLALDGARTTMQSGDAPPCRYMASPIRAYLSGRSSARNPLPTSSRTTFVVHIEPVLGRLAIQMTRTPSRSASVSSTNGVMTPAVRRRAGASRLRRWRARRSRPKPASSTSWSAPMTRRWRNCGRCCRRSAKTSFTPARPGTDSC